jgi:hexokinase
MPMGKGFKITSNPDLGSMVLAGYARHTQPQTNGASHCASPPLPRIKLAAISNDSVATLISLSYTTNAKPNSKAVIGLILGTGTNAAVPMPPATLHPKKVSYATRGDKVEHIVVNTEWTLRGVGPTLRNHRVITRWDEVLDHRLSTPGFQPFEYMTAGTYLGEVVRIAVREYFVDHLHISESSLPANLRKPYGLSTSWLGHHVAVTDDVQALSTKLNASTELSPPLTSDFAWTPALTNVLLQTERAISKRSTAMVASAIVALLVAIGEVNLLDREAFRDGTTSPELATNHHVKSSAPRSPSSQPERELVVAYCGGLICLYDGYLDRLKEDLHALRDVVAEKEVSILLREASEGGVIGAGVLAGTVAGTGAN